jgi:formate hydrogenlyase transcriptional activator
MRDLGQQGLLDTIHTLLQKPNLSELINCLMQLMKQGALADRVNILLYYPNQQRVSFYGKDKHGNELCYEDEDVLAKGPISHLFSRSGGLICSQVDFNETWPQIAAMEWYARFSHYCLLPLISDGKIVGGCECIRDSVDVWSGKELKRLHTLAQIVGLVTEQIRMRTYSDLDRTLLCRERDEFRILVAVTNAVLSTPNLDELISNIANVIHKHFAINSVGVVLRSRRQGWLKFYSRHFVDAFSLIHEQIDLPESGTFSERVFNSGEMLLTLYPGDKQTADEGMRPELWGNKSHMLCLLPLRFGNHLLGVLRLAKCREQGFTSADLNLLRQIADRVAIGVDNALAHQEINRLKARFMDANRQQTEQINNVSGHFGEIVGRSKAMLQVLNQVEMVAASDCTVLLLGETGTGKELIARAIHNLSKRNKRRMVKINCAAMPAGMLESELFGHERGAFTGANTQRIGRFELANKSSLLLDEIGDMQLELQPKLLRILQEREFERLGSSDIQQADVRLIAATNRNLKQMVDNREFRGDLYYRLNVFPITLPPLRERPEDIPLLVKSCAYNIARRLNRDIDRIPTETLRALSRMEWPGNVRELENIIERAILLTKGNVLQFSTAQMETRLLHEGSSATSVVDDMRDRQGEYQRILRALKETNGVVSGPHGAARRLGCKRTTLISRMRRLGIDKEKL